MFANLSVGWEYQMNSLKSIALHLIIEAIACALPCVDLVGQVQLVQAPLVLMPVSVPVLVYIFCCWYYPRRVLSLLPLLLLRLHRRLRLLPAVLVPTTTTTPKYTERLMTLSSCEHPTAASTQQPGQGKRMQARVRLSKLSPAA